MKAQKAIAVIMMLTSSVLTGLVSGDIAYPAILCMLGLLGLQRRFTWDIKPERRVITSLLLLVLAIVFSVGYRYGGSGGRIAFEQAAAFAWQTIARYFLASMILILFLGSPHRLPSSLGLFHVAITISAGQVLLLDDMYVAFRLSELFSVVLVVLYATTLHGPAHTPVPQRTAGTSRWLAFTLILIAAANCGWITSSILYRHVEVLNYLPVWFWRGTTVSESSSDGLSHVGFSTSGKLSSVLTIKGDQDPTPALSISCDSCPGYLRAKAFEFYRESEWHDWSHKEPVFPEQNRAFGMYFAGRKNIFRLDDKDVSDCEYMTIRHESQLADAVFTPLGTSFVEAPLNLLLRDDNDIMYAQQLRPGLNYRVGYAKSPHQKPPAGMQGHRMLNVPTQLDPRIRELAARIFVGCNTTAEKIDAVVRHFHTNYTYLLGLDVPADRDKLTYFLLEASTGYCEYFASGAAILLRLGEVPTRYVTGFLVTEQDPETELWVARNMDAHAWAEAWDQERNQWTIVEATVGEDASVASAFEQLGRISGGTGALLGRLLQALYEYGLFGLLSWLFESYGLFAGLLLPVAILGGAFWMGLSRYRRIRKSRDRGQARTARSPALVTLHRILAKMDRKLGSAGLQRQISETLHVFASRLRARESGDGLWTRISDWYVEYASLRYHRAIGSERLQQLQERARRLQDSL
ncbi:MAG: transglutaminase domain-containing protein [Planctomycetota bacterium]